MTKIYLIRHAETERVGDDAALWPLSERGRQQAQELAAQSFWPEVRAIISSDEQKAIQTVHAIAHERQIPLFPRECLRELRRTPEWIDDYEARVQEVFAQPAVSVGGWERAADAQARILRCMDQIILEHDPAPIAVVSHGMVMALLLATVQNAYGYVYEIWQSLGFASVTLMER